MKSEAPSPRDRLFRLAFSSGGKAMNRFAPQKLCTAGRGRSVGRSRAAGAPASARFQKSRSLSSGASRSHWRCQAAKSTYWIDGSGSGEGRPVRNAP